MVNVIGSVLTSVPAQRFKTPSRPAAPVRRPLLIHLSGTVDAGNIRGQMAEYRAIKEQLAANKHNLDDSRTGLGAIPQNLSAARNAVIGEIERYERAIADQQTALSQRRVTIISAPLETIEKSCTIEEWLDFLMAEKEVYTPEERNPAADNLRAIFSALQANRHSRLIELQLILEQWKISLPPCPEEPAEVTGSEEVGGGQEATRIAVVETSLDPASSPGLRIQAISTDIGNFLDRHLASAQRYIDTLSAQVRALKQEIAQLGTRSSEIRSSIERENITKDNISARLTREHAAIDREFNQTKAAILAEKDASLGELTEVNAGVDAAIAREARRSEILKLATEKQRAAIKKRDEDKQAKQAAADEEKRSVSATISVLQQQLSETLEDKSTKESERHALCLQLEAEETFLTGLVQLKDLCLQHLTAMLTLPAEEASAG